MPTRLLTVEEAAAILREHPQTTRQRLREGQIRGVKKAKGDRAPWLITEKALDAYITRSTR